MISGADGIRASYSKGFHVFKVGEVDVRDLERFGNMIGALAPHACCAASPKQTLIRFCSIIEILKPAKRTNLPLAKW